MKLRVRFTWHARRSGGLIIGLRLTFPVSVCERVQELEGTEEEHWKVVTFGLCLLVATVSFDFEYGHYRETIPACQPSAVWQRAEPPTS